MAERSWQLRQGERLVGTLALESGDMFWSDCRFEPGPAWEGLAPLFAASRDAWRRGDEDAAWPQTRRSTPKTLPSFQTAAQPRSRSS